MTFNFTFRKKKIDIETGEFTENVKSCGEFTVAFIVTFAIMCIMLLLLLAYGVSSMMIVEIYGSLIDHSNCSYIVIRDGKERKLEPETEFIQNHVSYFLFLLFPSFFLPCYLVVLCFIGIAWLTSKFSCCNCLPDEVDEHANYREEYYPSEVYQIRDSFNALRLYFIYPERYIDCENDKGTYRQFAKELIMIIQAYTVVIVIPIQIFLAGLPLLIDRQHPEFVVFHVYFPILAVIVIFACLWGCCGHYVKIKNLEN